MLENKKSNLEDIMMAADIVDTIRNDIRRRDSILSEKDQEEQTRRDLIAYYKSQNTKVSEEIIDQAFKQLSEKRYVFVPLDQKKWSTKFATLWIGRWIAARDLSIALAVVFAVIAIVNTTQYIFITKPQQKIEASNAKLIKVDFPARLRKIEDELEKTRQKITFDPKIIEDMRMAKEAAYTALQQKNIKDAEQNIEALSGINTKMQNEIAFRGMKSILDERKITLAKTEMDDDARNFMAPLIKQLENDTETGNQGLFNITLKNIDKELSFIKEPLEFRIVDRENMLSGLWRTNNGGNNKFYYLIVEAVDTNGKTIPLDIQNSETGQTNNVIAWGINVPEAEFKKVASDKKANGMISDNKAGIKLSGTRKIDWDRPILKNRMITKW